MAARLAPDPVAPRRKGAADESSGNAVFCSTRIVCPPSYLKALAAITRGRNYTLVTSAGWVRRGAVDAIARALGEPACRILTVPSHPKLDDVCRLEADVSQLETVVALGGGSVIDLSKVLIAMNTGSHGTGGAQVMRRRLCGLEPLVLKEPNPTLIAIPTTAGTGSEVTSTATVWGSCGEKYSIAHPLLRPAWAVLDPHLCATMGGSLALCTGLDAVSHAMEAIWNRRHTPVSDMAATASLRVLRTELQKRYRGGELLSATRRQVAALYAGLAIGVTSTALAHSISYPITARMGVPHGFACSFTLGEVARFNLKKQPDRLRLIAECFDCEVEHLPGAINEWLRRLRIARHLRPLLEDRHLPRLAPELINPTRAGNNLRFARAGDALCIVQRSLEVLT